ncbi:MAG: hypothetical protein ACI9F9_001074 [Candidatus Paceibacteria bacterium]
MAFQQRARQCSDQALLSAGGLKPEASRRSCSIGLTRVSLTKVEDTGCIDLGAIEQDLGTGARFTAWLRTHSSSTPDPADTNGWNTLWRSRALDLEMPSTDTPPLKSLNSLPNF